MSPATTTPARAGGEPDTSPPTGATPARASRRRGFRWQHLIPLVLVLAGVVVLLYPVLATQYNNVKQQGFAQQYNKDIDKVDPRDLTAGLAAAREYNATVNGVPILDPWLPNISSDPGSEEYRTYLDQLDRFDVMARVRIPRVGIDLPIYHGTSDDVLVKGAGHLYGTSLPVGGPGTHAVMTSHTGIPSASLFDHVHDVVDGDLIFIDVSGETLAYRVDQIKVVLPDEIDSLTAVPGHDYLTVFTCTPYGINSHRLLVRAERIEWSPTVSEMSETKVSAIRIERWMWWLLGGAALGLLLAAVIVLGERRRRHPSSFQTTPPPVDTPG